MEKLTSIGTRMFLFFKIKSSKIRFIIILYFLVSSFNSILLGQCEKVHVFGKLTDTLNPTNFYYTVIYNKSKDKAFFGDHDGKFDFFAFTGDTIVISVQGYPFISLKIENPENCELFKNIILQHRIKDLNPIILRPLKTTSQIKEERMKLVMEKTRMVTGTEILNSPITYLYESFSKKERNKRWVQQQLYNDQKNNLIKDYIRTCIAFKLIDLDSELIEDFVLYLNINEEFFKSASDYDLALDVKKRFLEYSSKK